MKKTIRKRGVNVPVELDAEVMALQTRVVREDAITHVNKSSLPLLGAMYDFHQVSLDPLQVKSLNEGIDAVFAAKAKIAAAWEAEVDNVLDNLEVRAVAGKLESAPAPVQTPPPVPKAAKPKQLKSTTVGV